MMLSGVERCDGVCNLSVLGDFPTGVGVPEGLSLGYVRLEIIGGQQRHPITCL